MDDFTTVSLTPFDNIAVRVYSPIVLCLSLGAEKDPKTVHKILQDGLSQTVAQIPFLAGTLAIRQPNDQDPRVARLEIKIPKEPSVKLRFNDLRGTRSFDELREARFPQHQLKSGDLFPISYVGMPNLDIGAKVLVAQANYLKGGVILALALHHSTADAYGGAVFLKTWTQNVRLLQDPQMSPPPAAPLKGFTRQMLTDLWLEAGNVPTPYETLAENKAAWTTLGPLPITRTETTNGSNSAPVATGFPPTKPTVLSMFYLSPTALSRLKNVASHDGPLPDDFKSTISTNDGLMALLWRSIMRARFPPASLAEDKDLSTTLDHAIDARSRFSPKLKGSPYMGNMLAFNSVTLPLSILLSSSTSLGFIAAQVRKSLDTVTTAKVHAAFGLGLAIPDMSKLRFPMATFEGAELYVTSMANMPSYDESFGDLFENGGKPEKVRLVFTQFASICRTCVVLPKMVGGGMEVLLTLLPDEMDRILVDEEFTTYMEFISH